VLDQGLRRKVDALWDKFWAGGLPNPLMAIDQMNYLIFLNRLEAIDDLEARRADARGEKHESIFEGEAKECRFSFWKNLPAEEMFGYVQSVVFPWMKGLAPDNHAFTSFMRDAAFLIPKPSLLVEAVNVIDELRITDRNIDTQGDIYEYMLRQLNVAGQIGQFRTPRHIIRAIVQMADPGIGELVVDPACGTAGFLVAAFQHVVATATSEEFLTYDEEGVPQGAVGDKLSREQWAWLREEGLEGYDLDPSMVRIAAMNMVLHGVDRPKVAYADSLGKGFSHAARANVVLANPPFSGSVDPSDISDEFRVKTKKTELLFVDLIEQMLVPGGRAAVIVPDSVLFSRQAKAHSELRRRLVEECDLQAIVHLPSGVFRPYSTKATGVLFFTKGGRTETVWMYGIRADGYSLDDRRLPISDNDLTDLLEKWERRAEGANSLVVTADAIRDNDYDLSLNTYLPFAFEGSAGRTPEEILDQAEATVHEVDAGLADLRKLLE